MSPSILWLFFVIMEATLIFVCVSTKARSIEADLRLKSLQALRARNVDLGDGFVMDGRDAWLTGAASSDAEKANAGLAVAEVRGVRVVHNLLKAGAEAAPIRPSPLPAPSRAPSGRTSGAGALQGAIDGLIAGRSVEFESGSDRLTAQSAALMDELAALIVRNADAHVVIAGHTDSQGTSRNNLEISRRRAEAVRARLVAGGVQQSRLTAEGYGEDDPVADNSTPEGRVRNRRVEFTVR